MSIVKKLAGQTLFYGLSSILGRAVTFCLTPLYTYSQIVSLTQYGQLTELMNYIGILMVFTTLRFEVSYFRFNSKHNEKQIYSTTLLTIFTSSFFISALIFAFSNQLSDLLEIENGNLYFKIIALVMFLDGCAEIPFSKLRFQERAKKFALIKILNILLNVLLNVFFVLVCPFFSQKEHFLFMWFNPNMILQYILFSYLFSSILTILLLHKEILAFEFKINFNAFIQMLRYSTPLIIVGLAGAITERFSIASLKWLLNGTMAENQVQLGIYSAGFRIAVIISLFTQAFRYAAEPFFFKEKNEKNAEKTYADITKYFLIFCVIGYLFVTLNINIFKYLVEKSYWDGLVIVPILLLANILSGVYYNVSIWYRLKDKTKIGAIIAIIGSILTIILNYVLVPIYGFIGAASSSLICYCITITICILWGRKYMIIPYDFKRILFYLFLGILIQIIFYQFRGLMEIGVELIFSQIGIIIYIMIVYYKEVWVKGFEYRL